MSRCAVIEETQMPFRSVDLLGLSRGNSMAMNLNRPWTADDDKRLLEMRASGRSNIFHLGGAKAQSIGGKGSHFHFARARSRRSTFGCFA
jgi:hypothetical protein